MRTDINELKSIKVVDLLKSKTQSMVAKGVLIVQKMSACTTKKCANDEKRMGAHKPVAVCVVPSLNQTSSTELIVRPPPKLHPTDQPSVGHWF
eukprot:1134420-Pelagomonas_calceolata.AAC.1